ncbi:MAG: ExbD/TolR family protein [Deltaproteobacteria bacterium]|jgi:biopolymer transport protein TolR|nr:ExbD/TolR family protein [Deltaproteobacteria bacterium]
MAERDELIPGQSDLKSISDINVTPFIDVMLVLLIIFMVTAPLMMGGVRINLPKTGGTPLPRPEDPIIVSLDSQSQIFVDKDLVPVDSRMDVFKKLALESESGEVFVRGDGDIKYSQMMNLMAELGQAGFARVTLVTNVQSGSPPERADAVSGGAQDAAGAALDGASPSPQAPAAPPAAPSAASPQATAAPAPAT